MSVPVWVIFPHIVKGRLVDWIPSKNALFALLESALELIREEYVCYPVRVLVFVVLEEDERSNFSRLLDFLTSLFVNFSYSTLFSSLPGLKFSAWRVPFAGSEEPGVLLQQQNPVIVEDEAQGRLNRHRNDSGVAFLFEQDDGLRKVSA